MGGIADDDMYLWGMQSRRGSQAVQQSVMLMHKIKHYLSVNPHALRLKSGQRPAAAVRGE